MLTTTDTGDTPSQSAVAGNLAVGPGFRAGRVIGLFLLILALLHELYQAERRLLDGQIIDVPFTRLVTIAAEGLGNRVLPFEVERRGDIILGTVPSTLADSKDQPLSTTVVIRGGCNGIGALFLMIAGILALPASWPTRLRTLFRDLPLLFGLSLVRILGLLYTWPVIPTGSTSRMIRSHRA